MYSRLSPYEISVLPQRIQAQAVCTKSTYISDGERLRDPSGGSGVGADHAIRKSNIERPGIVQASHLFVRKLDGQRADVAVQVSGLGTAADGDGSAILLTSPSEGDWCVSAGLFSSDNLHRKCDDGHRPTASEVTILS